MPDLTVTSIVAALFALMLIALDFGVIQLRLKGQISLESGGDEQLLKRIRAQGNFSEHVPLGLIALGLVELAGAASMMVWLVGGTLLVGRGLHAHGMYTGVLPTRQAGMVLTHASLAIAAVLLLLKHLA